MELTETSIPEEVKNLLKITGFRPLSVLRDTPTWIFKGAHPRYKETVVIKIAGTQRDSILLRNHILWTKSLAEKVPRNASFHLVTVLEDGWEGILQWCLMPYVKGTPLAHTKGLVSKVDATLLEEALPGIIALLQFIERNDALSVLGIDGRIGSISKKGKLSLLQTAIEWARPDTPHLAELLQIINANYHYLGVTNSHGDFTETNIIINEKNEPVLIDADISNALNYKYYDTVEFYNRLYTRACNPEIARTFLTGYLDSLPKQTRGKFLNNFLCLSAMRCIGNFMEITSLKSEEGKKKRLEYAYKYAEEIVSHRILLSHT